MGAFLALSAERGQCYNFPPCDDSIPVSIYFRNPNANACSSPR